MPESLTDLVRQELAQIEQKMQQLEQRRQAILSLLRVYGRLTQSAAANGKLLDISSAVAEPISTLDMAQQVIEKRGPMKAEDIMEAIRQDFGVKPAHTLAQMLYIRSRAKKRFYRGADGRFGLIEKKKAAKRAAA
jgi:HB1, ASXL, restriction endonuclease HTH domain